MCVSYLPGNKFSQNLVALNNDNIHFAHEPEVCQGLVKMTNFSSPGVTWSSSKAEHWNHPKSQSLVHGG